MHTYISLRGDEWVKQCMRNYSVVFHCMIQSIKMHYSQNAKFKIRGLKMYIFIYVYMFCEEENTSK